VGSDNKIILKRKGWEGVDKSIIDFNQVSTTPVVVTKVILSMYKKNGKTFVGVRDGLIPGEVISIRPLGLKYKIIGPMIKKIPQGGGLYRVKRVDGANTTNTDLQNALAGNKIKITNRRSFRQMFDQVPYNQNLDLPEPPCPPKYSAYECEQTCVDCGQPETTPPVEPQPEYLFTISRPFGSPLYTITYMTNSGSAEIEVTACSERTCEDISFCAIPYTLVVEGVEIIASNQVCLEEPCQTIGSMVMGPLCE
jgi:hypothetical protein